MHFRSKIDIWLAVLLGAFVVGGPILAMSVAPAGQLTATSIAIVGGVSIGSGLLLIWIYRSTFYTIEGNTLHVRSMGMSWDIDATTIRRVSATRSPLSAPALSLDRMEIEYGRFGSVVISPEAKREFICAIAERAPQATFEGLDEFR